MSKWVAAALAAETAALALLLTIAFDLYAHKRVEELGGVNIWGYRGAVARQRQPNEIRIAFVGGTRAFGWGMTATGAVPSALRRLVMLTTDRRGGQLRPVVMINLGRLGALPDSYTATIDHYAYLKPDYICIYDDLGVPGAPDTDHSSAVFALTGYAPVLPLVLREKGMVWRFGDVKRGYLSGESRTASQTGWMHRAAASTLETVGAGIDAIDRTAARMIVRGTDGPSVRGDGMPGYADAMMGAIDAAHVHARGVVVLVASVETAEQLRNSIALKARLDLRLVSSPWLRFVSLGDTAAVYDEALRLDGWNYSSAGIAVVAETLAPAVLDLIAGR